MDEQSQDARYAPPRSHVEDVRQEGAQPGQLASRGKRLAAAIVDGLIAAGMLWLIAKYTPFNPWSDAGLSLWTPRFLSIAFGFAVFLVMHGYLLVTRGQTIGKALLKLRIVRPDGSRASIGRVIGLRYAAPSLLHVVPVIGQVFALGDALFIFRESRRCLHDQIADTIVVQA
jgi:uncharacterized RDD family membrane protein YckC